MGGGIGIEQITRELDGAWAIGDRDAIASALDSGRSFWGQDVELDRLMTTATLWHGDPRRLGEHQTLRGGESFDFFHPVVDQIVVRARRGEATWEDLEGAIRDCELLDSRPRRGLQTVANRAVAELPHVARILGAERVVLGRPERLGDDDPLLAEGDLRCGRDRIVDSHRIPERLPRVLYFASLEDEQRLYLSIRAEGDDAWAFVTNSGSDANRLLEAGMVWEDTSETPDEIVLETFGPGLVRP